MVRIVVAQAVSSAGPAGRHAKMRRLLGESCGTCPLYGPPTSSDEIDSSAVGTSPSRFQIGMREGPSPSALIPLDFTIVATTCRSRGVIAATPSRMRDVRAAASASVIQGSARKAGESDDRIATVAAWREAPFFTDAERAALALAEAVTRLADRPDPVPDQIWDDAADHYDEKGLAALILITGVTNLFNRLNATTRQVAGAWG